MIRALSWGCGVQSTTLAVMSALGDLEPLEAVVTADTGWERKATYEAREFYTAWLQERGMRVEVVSAGNIRQGGMQEHYHMPFFTGTTAPLQRQCTGHFKIYPIKRRLRELSGYHATKPPHPPADAIELWLGISWDEWTRMKKGRVKFIAHRWPLIEGKITRNACVDYLEAHGLPVPVKSACVGCPWRRASEWLEIRNDAPGDWADVIEFDQAVRHSSLTDHSKLTSEALYVYKKAVPLATADLEADAKRERKGKQLALFVCEEGYCHV